MNTVLPRQVTLTQLLEVVERLEAEPIPIPHLVSEACNITRGGPGPEKYIELIKKLAKEEITVEKSDEVKALDEALADRIKEGPGNDPKGFVNDLAEINRQIELATNLEAVIEQVLLEVVRPLDHTKDHLLWKQQARATQEFVESKFGLKDVKYLELHPNGDGLVKVVLHGHPDQVVGTLPFAESNSAFMAQVAALVGKEETNSGINLVERL